MAHRTAGPIRRTLPPPPEYGHYFSLSPDRQRFVDEYLLDLNGNAAALRAGYRDPHRSSYSLLNRADVQAAIKERRETLSSVRTQEGAQFVLNKLWDVATADPRELADIRRVPCRYCWGINGQYQFTKTEMDRLLKAHEYGRASTPFQALWPFGDAEYAYYVAGGANLPFDSQGGDGYTVNRDPNPSCSECAGLGITLHYVADTRKLSKEARQLYRGIKLGQRGQIEILMANQDAARDMLARHYGVAVERREVFVRSPDPRTLSDQELLQGLAELEAIDLDGSEYKRVDEARLRSNREMRQQSAARARAARKQKLIQRPRSEP